MKYIGLHVDGYPEVSRAPREAAAIGARAFALNLTDPSRWKSPAIAASEAEAFRAECALAGFTAAQILPHAGFVINAASPDARKLKLSRLALADEMNRAALLGLGMLNFHPGAHLNALPVEDALARVAETINITLAETPAEVSLIIENTAGQGTSLGRNLHEIATILSAVSDSARVGVCIDSAHAFAAGYDLATDEGYDAFWQEFDREIGRDRLRGMHINDSLKACGSRVDRHAPIGRGLIGRHFFERLMADSRTDGIPLILETPDPALWTEEVVALQQMAMKENI